MGLMGVLFQALSGQLLLCRYWPETLEFWCDGSGRLPLTISYFAAGMIIPGSS